LPFLLEFGIFQPKHCSRYQLEASEDGDWFHSGIDGSLFVPEHDFFFYSNQDYCVDYFYNKRNQAANESQVID